MSASRRARRLGHPLLLAATIAASVGCKRDVPEPAPTKPVDVPSATPAAVAAQADGGAKDAATLEGTDERTVAKLADADARAYLHAAPEDGKSVGHTSVVFKLSLVGGFEAAFKPRSKRGGGRYKGEIAAYRLARALGIENVPRAFPRSFPKDALRDALARHPDAVALFDKEVIAEPDGTVRGALIPWIHDLSFLPLESAPWRARWGAWLSGSAPIPAEDKRLAEQIGNMILFDYVTGNWDRWSGANVGFDKPTGTILYVDNDGAFFESPPAEAMRRQLDLITHMRRVSPTFVAALRRMTPNEVESALGSEDVPDAGTPGSTSTAPPLLSAKVLAGVEARRTEALARIGRTDGGLDFE